MPIADSIREFYEQFDEAGRLDLGVFQLERERTRELLGRFLPKPPAVVYDIGGGAGAYAFGLAENGYVVHLVDATPKHVALAQAIQQTRRQHRLASVTLGEARRLDFADASAQAALLLGPLYHLLERDDRIAALREAHRVLKPGGVLMGAAISRFASMLDGFMQRFMSDPEFVQIVRNDLAQGMHHNETGKIEYFTDSYFHRPEELAEECEAAGLIHDRTMAIEGPGWLAHDFDDWWRDSSRRALLLDLVRRVETEPTLLGASAHLMVVARRS